MESIRPPRPDLEPDADTQRAWLEAAGQVALGHLATVVDDPMVADPKARTLTSPPPIGEAPLAGGIEAALAVVAGAAQASLSTTAPGYLAYIPGGGLFATAVADLVADVFNRYTGLAAPSPGFARLESDVLAWLAGQFGYGPEAAGLFTSGGSLAIFAAVVAAREAVIGAWGDLRDAVGYTSTQAHASIAAAFRLAGLPPANLRAVPVDGAFRLRTSALAEMARTDRASGLRPFMVIASAGTTNTGAVDPMSDIAALCAAEGMWLHIDAAYGGAFVLCDEGRRRLGGIALANSIAFDPHKGLFLPYGTGCLLLRDGPPRLTATEGDDSYLGDFRPAAGEQGLLSPADFGLELTRPFRGLRVWLPLMLHGAGAFRQALTEKLALAASLHRGLMACVKDGVPLEIVAEPQLTVVPFRLSRARDEPLAAWNLRNLALLNAINGRGRCYLSSTLLPVADGEAVTLRPCVLSFRTHQREIDRCLEDIRLAAKEMSPSEGRVGPLGS